MTYSLQAYLDSIRTNWYANDELLHRLLWHYAGKSEARAARELDDWGARVAGRLRELAEESARPENRPRLRHVDATNRRVDEIGRISGAVSDPDVTIRFAAFGERVLAEIRPQ